MFAPPEVQAVRSVRRGVRLYRWAVILAIGTQLVGVALLFADPSYGKIFDLSSSTGATLSSGVGGGSGAAVALLALAALLGLAGFVLSLVAFTDWREGVLALRQVTVVSGTYSVVPPTGAAAKAHRGYRLALWTILVLILASVTLGVVSAVIIFGGLHGTIASNGTLVPAPTSQVNASLTEVFRLGLGFGVVALAIQLVLARYVTESLEGIVDLTGPRTSPESLRTTRLLVYAGVVVGVGGLLNAVYIGLGAVAVLSPILFFFACQRYLAALGPETGPDSR
jgi:hypothetical protein